MHENKVINYEQNGKSYSAYFYVPYADRCVCLINDVTDLKKLKEGTIRALEHENQLLQEKNNQIRLYKTILDQTGIIVFENDLKHSSCYISENVHHYCFKNKIFLPDGTPNPDAVLLKDRVKFMREFSIKYNGHSENQIKTTVRTELIDGSYVWCKFAAKVTFTKQGAPSRITGTIQNVTNEQEYLNTLRRKAEYDTITDIYNKQTFFARTEYLLKHHSPSDFCIIRFDVDNFKMINEFFGHDEGDRLLKHIASKLEKLMLNYNYCNYGHLEADIFAVCMKTSDSKNAISKIEKIADDFDIEFKVTISVGIYNITETNLSPDIMCDRAHLAQKTVKGNFLLHSAYFNQQMHESIINDQMIASMMNQAIEERQFIVYYQPKFNIATNKISGAEALVRWIHPEKGLIYPGSFIPVFEKNGFIMKLDEYVWEDVCIYIRKNLDMGNTVLPISVNISKINLYNPKLCDILIGLVQKYNIPTSLFQLELTESAFTDNKAVMDNIMSKLKAYGFTIMMDDFGSGYSSLSMLKEIPVDVLKIDLRFLSVDGDCEKGGKILSSIITMAKWLNMHIVTEGIESLEQLCFLKTVGCEEGQGFFFSKPVTENSYDEMIKQPHIIESSLSKPSRPINNMNELWDPNSALNIMFSSMIHAAGFFEYSNGNYKVIRLNDNFFAMTGLDRSCFNINSPLHIDTLYETDHEKIHNMFEKALVSGSVEKDNIKYTDTDGKTRSADIEVLNTSVNSIGGVFFVTIKTPVILE